MTGPCERPDCGGATHTDGWGQPIRCPHACPPAGPDTAQATPLEEAQATIESLRYQIRRAREALGADEPVDRCPSCDHKGEFHDVDGRCWFTVDHGVPEHNLGCACRIPRKEQP